MDSEGFGRILEDLEGGPQPRTRHRGRKNLPKVALFSDPCGNPSNSGTVRWRSAGSSFEAFQLSDFQLPASILQYQNSELGGRCGGRGDLGHVKNIRNSLLFRTSRIWACGSLVYPLKS